MSNKTTIQYMPSNGKFHRVEQSVPWGGTKCSIGWNKVFHGVEHLHTLYLLLLMLVFGVEMMWGQTDYSGTYYIASHGYDISNPGNTDNFYLCPTKGWCSYKATDNYEAGDNMPFLTTYQCKTNGYTDGADNAVWIIEKAPNSDYYYIIHKKDGKYIVSNGKIDTTTNPDRIRVHLEEVADDNALVALGDKVLFSINPYASNNKTYMVIRPMSITDETDGSDKNHDDYDHTTHRWLTVNGGNVNSLKGASGKTGGPGTTNDKYKYTKGIVGIFTEGDTNADFYFEDVITRPTITINSDKKVEITAAQTGEVTIKYTIDGSDPASNGTEYTGPINPSEGTTIKAVAIVSGETSNVATLQRRLIQNQNNGWTVDESTKDFHFYMTQGDDDNSITKVNTTSLFRPSMEWYLIDAKNGLKYIVNASNNKYLCYDGSNVFLADYNDTNDNKFKFGIRKSPTAGTFNICPYLKYILFKSNGNDNADALSAWAYSDDHFNSGNARWKFVLPSDLDTTPPFTVSTTTSTNYYHIASVGSDGYFIVPPTGSATAVTTTNQAAQEKNGRWYFEVAQAATNTDWCTYYHIRNAVTGDYLYFTKDGNNVGACLEMRGTIESSNEDRYLFTWAKTAITGTYYIVPKKLKDVSLNNFSALRKHDSNTNILTNVTRAAVNFAWTFTDADLFCNAPEFVEEEGKIRIKCNTNAAKIYINTENNDNPTSESTLYDPLTNENQNWATTAQVRIKAIAVVSDGTASTPNTASSDVITLLNNPKITLPQDTYTYDGTAQQPAVSEVSIGEVPNKTTAASTDFTVESTDYSNNINAGTAKVTLRDKASSVYVWHAEKEFTINKKGLTVTANNHSITYGDEPANNGVTYSGFVGGEDENNLTGTLAYAYDYSQYGYVGDYTITPSGLTSGNYDISYVGGKLTVTPKTLTITAVAKEKTYGDSDPELTYTSEGLVGSDAITGALSREAGEDAGTYAIVQNTLTASNNYVITYVPANLTINKKGLTITAVAKEKTYGDSDPELTYTSEGLVGSDAITGSLSRDSGEDAGTYAIVQNTLTAGSNYAITYVPANLTINKKELIVTANDHSITYGDEPTNNGVTYSGFVGEDDESVLGSTLAYAYSYSQFGDVGSYTITPSGSTTNYTITPVDGTLTVTPKEVGIDWTNTELTYNRHEQTPTATATGLVNGDVIAVTVTGAQINAGNDYIATASVLDGTKAGNYLLPEGLTQTFIILPKSIGDGNKAADGIAIILTEAGELDKVTDGSELLVVDQDYTSTYEIVGSDKLFIITGMGNYKDSAKGIYARPVFTDADGEGSGQAAAVYKASLDMACPSGITPYIVRKVNPSIGTLVISEIEYIPEDVPVLLLSDNVVEGFVVSPKDEETPEITAGMKNSNQLKESYEGLKVEAAQIYLFFRGEFVLTKAGTFKGGGKFFLYNPNFTAATPTEQDSSRGILEIVIEDWDDLDETTGVEPLSISPEGERTEAFSREGLDGVWYDFSGRRVAQPVKGGIYIYKGQKVYIKKK